MLGVLSPSEIQFISDGVAQNVRIDGRGRFDYRPYMLETGVISQTNGSARIKIGKTHVLVGIKAALAEPSPIRPEEGLIEVTVDCLPSASPNFEGRGAEDLNIKFASVIQHSMLSADHLDLKSLCLLPKRQCWKLYIDAVVLDSGGNLFDAISIATRAALATTTIPRVKVVESRKTGEYELELSDDPDDFLTIPVDKVPIFTTFNQIGSFSVVDPCLEEELCMGCRTTIGINSSGNICAIDKGNGSLKASSLPELTIAATNIGTKIISDIDAILEAEKSNSRQKPKTLLLD